MPSISHDNPRLLSARLRPDGSNASTPAWQVEGFGNDGTRGDQMDLRMNDPIPGNWFSPDAINALANAGETPQGHHVTFITANSGHPDLSGNAYSRTLVDGVQTGLESEIAWNGFAIGNTDGQLIIGGHAENAGSRAFTGLLDDVAIFAGIVPDAEITAIASGAKSPADLLGGEGEPLRLAIAPSGSNLVLSWNSKAGKVYTIRTDSGGIGVLDPAAWPVYAGFTGVAADPPANTLIIPRPGGDDEAYFVVEEVAGP